MTSHLRHHRISLHYDYNTNIRSVTINNKTVVVSRDTYFKVHGIAYRDGNELRCHDDLITCDTLYAITQNQYALFLLMLK